MLVLSRSIGESVVIGDMEVEVFLISVKDMESVRLGFRAPPHVEIHRKEIYERIQQHGRPSDGPQ